MNKKYISIFITIISVIVFIVVILFFFKDLSTKNIQNNTQQNKNVILWTWSTGSTVVWEAVLNDKIFVKSCTWFLDIPYLERDKYIIDKQSVIKYLYFKWLAYWDYDFLKKYYEVKDEDVYKKEYLFQKSLKDKQCSALKWYSEDEFQVCEIYASWDLNRFNNFQFSDWEKWSNLISFFEKINSWKIGDDYNLNTIYHFYDYEKNIKIDFSESNFWSREYIYIKANGKDKFLEELNSQFLLECEKNK